MESLGRAAAAEAEILLDIAWSSAVDGQGRPSEILVENGLAGGALGQVAESGSVVAVHGGVPVQVAADRAAGGAAAGGGQGAVLGHDVVVEDAVGGGHVVVIPPGGVPLNPPYERRVVRVSRRLILGELLLRANASDARFNTDWEDGAFVCTVESRVPRGAGPRRRGLMRARGRAAGSATQAEEAAAERFIILLRWNRRVVVDDTNWERANRLRRQAALSRASSQAARGEKEQALLEKQQALLEKQRAVAKAAVLEEGLNNMMGDLISIRDVCDEICSSGSARLGPETGVDDLAGVLDALLDLSASMQYRIEMLDVCLAQAVGTRA